MSQIFLSYRRAEHPALIGRIYDRLTSEFGKDSVFLDVDSIPLGVDFKPHLKEQVSRCAVFVAVIGKEWLSRIDSLFREDDFIRIEIESALALNKPIIPLLVDVEMPQSARLPQGLQIFSGRNGMKLDPGQDFHNHMARFIFEVASVVGLEKPESSSRIRPKQKTISNVVMNVIDEIQQMLERPGRIQGLSSGFEAIDQLIDGFQPSGLYVLAAEPNTGITSLLLSIVNRILTLTEAAVLWVDAGVSEEVIGRRLLYNMCALSAADLKRGLLSRKEQDCLAKGVRFLQKANLSIISTSEDIRGLLAEQLAIERSLRPGLIVIDGFSSGAEAQDTGYFLELARFAKLARIPLICALGVSVTRGSRHVTGKLKDANIAPEVLQSASLVAWLSVEDDLAPEEPPLYREATLSLLLNKNGALGEVPLNFWPQFSAFSAERETTVRSWSPIVKSVEDETAQRVNERFRRPG